MYDSIADARFFGIQPNRYTEDPNLDKYKYEIQIYGEDNKYVETLHNE